MLILNVDAPDYNLSYKGKKLNNALLYAFSTIPGVDSFGTGSFSVGTTGSGYLESGFLSQRGNVFIQATYIAATRKYLIKYKNASPIDILRHFLLTRIYNHYSNEIGGKFLLKMISASIKETDENFPAVAEFIQKEEEFILLDEDHTIVVEPFLEEYDIEQDSIKINDEEFQSCMGSLVPVLKEEVSVPVQQEMVATVVPFVTPELEITNVSSVSSFEEMDIDTLFNLLKEYKITIQQIADRAGVAKSTVSLVKNSKPTSLKAQEVVRKNVIDALKEKGVVPEVKEGFVSVPEANVQVHVEAAVQEKQILQSVSGVTQEQVAVAPVVVQTPVVPPVGAEKDAVASVAPTIHAMTGSVPQQGLLGIKPKGTPVNPYLYADPCLYRGEVVLDEETISKEYLIKRDAEVEQILRSRYGFEEAKIEKIMKIRKRNRNHFGQEFWSHIPKKIKYIGDTDLLWDVLSGAISGRNTSVYGPTGCGKSVLYESVCCILNYPLFRINGNEETGLDVFLGAKDLENGEIVVADDSYVKAAKIGAFLYYDEMNKGGSVKFIPGMNSQRQFLNKLNSTVVFVHKYFRFGASYNLEYIGENPPNEATKSHCSSCAMTYGSSVQLLDIVKQLEEELLENDEDGLLDPLSNETREAVFQIFQAVRQTIETPTQRLRSEVGSAREIEQMLHRLMMGSTLRRACLKYADKYPECRVKLLTLMGSVKNSGIGIDDYPSQQAQAN